QVRSPATTRPAADSTTTGQSVPGASASRCSSSRFRPPYAIASSSPGVPEGLSHEPGSARARLSHTTITLTPPPRGGRDTEGLERDDAPESLGDAGRDLPHAHVHGLHVPVGGLGRALPDRPVHAELRADRPPHGALPVARRAHCPA